MAFDPGKDIDEHVTLRLKSEQVIWLTTVGANGTPHPRPVWFLWDGETFLIFSQPNTAKMRDIMGNRRVALNLNSDESGSEVVVFLCEAEVLPGNPDQAQIQAYTDKYRDGIASLGYTPEQMLASYNKALRMRPVRMYGFFS